jgi:hypothetical protein
MWNASLRKERVSPSLRSIEPRELKPLKIFAVAVET